MLLDEVDFIVPDRRMFESSTLIRKERHRERERARESERESERQAGREMV